MFNRFLVSGALFIVFCSLFIIGCGSHRRTEVTNVSPVVTYSIVFVDSFSDKDRQQLIDSIALVFSAIQTENITNVTTVVNNTVSVNITNSHIGPFNGHDEPNGNVLSPCGESNECPELYDRIFCSLLGDEAYEKDKPRLHARGLQLASECRSRH